MGTSHMLPFHPFKEPVLASLTQLSAPAPHPLLGLAVLQPSGHLLPGSIPLVKAEHGNAAAVEQTAYLWVIAARTLGRRPITCVLPLA